MDKSTDNTDKSRKSDSATDSASRIRPAVENSLGEMGTGPMRLLQGCRSSRCGASLGAIAQRMASLPAAQRRQAAMSLQRSRGNRFVQAMATQVPVQPKMMAGAARGEYERAASVPEVQAVQRQADPEIEEEEDDEEVLQGKFLSAQRASRAGEGKPQQCMDGGAYAPAAEAVRPEPNRTGMPDRLKAGIESLSGIDMSDVRVHANSDKPARLDALAYTQGNQIYLGPGQERHLPHEAWHAVQQKQGKVRATGQMKGVGVNDDSGLEEEADRVGAKAMHGEAATAKRIDPLSPIFISTAFQGCVQCVPEKPVIASNDLNVIGKKAEAQAERKLLKAEAREMWKAQVDILYRESQNPNKDLGLSDDVEDMRRQKGPDEALKLLHRKYVGKLQEARIQYIATLRDIARAKVQPITSTEGKHDKMPPREDQAQPGPIIVEGENRYKIIESHARPVYSRIDELCKHYIKDSRGSYIRRYAYRAVQEEEANKCYSKLTDKATASGKVEDVITSAPLIDLLKNITDNVKNRQSKIDALKKIVFIAQDLEIQGNYARMSKTDMYDYLVSEIKTKLQNLNPIQEKEYRALLQQTLGGKLFHPLVSASSSMHEARSNKGKSFNDYGIFMIDLAMIPEDVWVSGEYTEVAERERSRICGREETNRAVAISAERNMEVLIERIPSNAIVSVVESRGSTSLGDVASTSFAPQL